MVKDKTVKYFSSCLTFFSSEDINSHERNILDFFFRLSEETVKITIVFDNLNKSVKSSKKIPNTLSNHKSNTTANSISTIPVDYLFELVVSNCSKAFMHAYYVFVFKISNVMEIALTVNTKKSEFEFSLGIRSLFSVNIPESMSKSKIIEIEN